MAATSTTSATPLPGQFCMDSIRILLAKISSDADILRLPAGSSAIYGAISLVLHHAGQATEASTYARRAEEACTQHMSAFARRQAITADLDLIKAAAVKITHVSKNADNTQAFIKINLDYAPNVVTPVVADSFSKMFPEVTLSWAGQHFNKWSIEAQNDYRDALTHSWDLVLRRFHEEIQRAYFKVSGLVDDFLEHAGCFPKYLRALLHMVS